MSLLALSPVSAAVYGVLNVASVTALAVGGVHDDVPQRPTYPFVWYEVQERDLRGFGTGELPEVTLRVHVFSQYAGLKQAQAVLRACVAVLKDVALTVAGYAMCGHVFYDETVTLVDEQIAGVKVHELVASFRIYVEAQ